MVTLVVFPTPWPKVPNGSPYCMKVENYLRIAKIPYEKKLTVDLKSAPKKRLPYIIHNGNKIADSQVIIPYLQNTFGIKSDLSAEDSVEYSSKYKDEKICTRRKTGSNF
jgi:glutathione S-transferase